MNTKHWIYSTIITGLLIGLGVSLSNGGEMLIERILFFPTLLLFINLVLLRWIALPFLRLFNQTFISVSVIVGVVGASVGCAIAYSFMMLTVSQERSSAETLAETPGIEVTSFSYSSSGWEWLFAILFVIWTINGGLLWLFKCKGN